MTEVSAELYLFVQRLHHLSEYGLAFYNQSSERYFENKNWFILSSMYLDYVFSLSFEFQETVCFSSLQANFNFPERLPWPHDEKEVEKIWREIHILGEFVLQVLRNSISNRPSMIIWENLNQYSALIVFQIVWANIWLKSFQFSQQQKRLRLPSSVQAQRSDLWQGRNIGKKTKWWLYVEQCIVLQ